MIIVGLDLSLTSTGVAIHNTDTGTTAVDTITSKAPITGRHPRTGKPLPATLVQRTERLDRLARQIVATTELANLVLIESPAVNSKTGHMHDRSGLWWLVVHQLDDAHFFPIVEITPQGRMKYATGKGNASKDAVLAAVVRRYPDIEVTGNDEADAVVLAAMGARHLGQPIETSLPATHTAAMDNVHWPALEVTNP